MKEKRLIELLKEVNKEVDKLEKEGFKVEISLPNNKYSTTEKITTVNIYKPISF